MKILSKPQSILFVIFMASGALAAQNPYTTQGYIAPINVIYPITDLDTTKPGWHIVFGDEFDGSTVDLSKWYVSQGTTTAPHVYMLASNTSIQTIGMKSCLTLKGEFHSTQVELPPGSGQYWYYTNAGIKSNNTNYDHFSTGKYYEIRCKLPRGLSYHPSFFQFIMDALGTPNGNWNEIDFWENGFAGLGYQHKLGCGYVKGKSNTNPQDPTCSDPNYPVSVTFQPQSWYPFTSYYCVINNEGVAIDIDASNSDFSEDFFTVGVEVQSDYIRWYLNNKLIRVALYDATHPLPDNILGMLWVELGINNYSLPGKPWSPYRDFDEDFYSDYNDLSDLPDTLNPDNDSISDITTAFTGVNAEYVVDYVRVYEKTCTPVNTAGLYSYSAGYTDENNYPRLMGDINADGMDDIVAFSSTNVDASVATGGGNFTSVTSVHITSFTTSGGWINSNYPRFLEDVNGDGKADIVGMNNNTLYVSLSTTITGGTTPSFATPVAVSSNFSISNGYTNMSASPRFMADLNGDDKADIIGFKGSSGVYVSLSTCSLSTISFTTPVALTGSSFTSAQGYSNQNSYPRIIEDVNHDFKADIIGFGPNGVQVSLSQCGSASVSFVPPVNLFNDLNFSHGYTSMSAHPRMIADVDGDYKKDIIAFGPNHVYIALSQSTASHPSTPYVASFVSPQFAMSFFTVNNGGFASQNDNPRFVADINCDGKADIIGISDGEVKIALSKCGGTTVSYYDYQNSIMGFSKHFGYLNNQSYLRKLADVTGDDKPDLVGFGGTQLQVFTCFSPVECLTGGGGSGLQGAGKEVENVQGEPLVYPNPNQGEFTIRLNQPIETSTIELINSIGESLAYTLQPVSKYEVKIKMNIPSKGIHFIRLYDQSGNKYTRKIMLE